MTAVAAGAGRGGGLVPVDVHLADCLAVLRPLEPVRVGLLDALDRLLAEDVVATAPLPILKPDAGLQNTPETRRTVVALIRAFRPRVVILPYPNGRHPDHRIASQLGYDACFLAGLKRFDAPGEPHRPHKLLYALAYREDAVKPSFVVDVTAQMETKMEAIRCYASQFDGKTWGGEVFPGGDRPLYDQVRMHAARYGSLIRTEYGEPFYIAETMEVEDVVGLGVRSI